MLRNESGKFKLLGIVMDVVTIRFIVLLLRETYFN